MFKWTFTAPSSSSPLQVSHHPPAAAHHVISDRGWNLRQEITVASKFRGKYLSIMPLGKSAVCGFIDFKHQKNIYEIGMSTGNYCGLMWHSLHDVFFLFFLSAVHCLSLPGTIHAIFEKSNNHYTWKKVTTTVHNIIVGKLWIDQVSVSLQESVWSGEWGSTLQQTILPRWKCLHSHFSPVSRQSGEIDVVNHTTGDRCHLKFAPYSYFSRDVARKVRNLLF